MDDLRRLGLAGVVAAAAVATLFAVAWRAAEEHRGLDLADLRSVVIVGAVVLLVGYRMGPRGRGS